MGLRAAREAVNRTKPPGVRHSVVGGLFISADRLCGSSEQKKITHALINLVCMHVSSYCRRGVLVYIHTSSPYSVLGLGKAKIAHSSRLDAADTPDTIIPTSHDTYSPEPKSRIPGTQLLKIATGTLASALKA